MLSRTARTEIGAADHDPSVLRVRKTEQLGRFQIRKQIAAPTAALNPLQKTSRYDLVRVDVLRRKCDHPRCHTFKFVHTFTIFRRSATLPATAEAAAVSGDASNVRPPGPWRPSKFRLLVLI